MSKDIDREIVYEHVTDFINSFNNLEYMKEMREYADEHHVPILEQETEDFLKLLVSMIKPKKVLELGTAIGYSAISLTKNSGIEKYITIELREDMTEIARKNIDKYGLSNIITVINNDAYDELQKIDEKFDLIFIDAAKGQYKKYFDICESLLNENGTIICDNVLFRGMVTKKELLVRRKKTLVKRLRDFITYIKNDERFISSIIPLGDGLLLIRRKNEES